MNRSFRDVARRRMSLAQLRSSPKNVSASEVRKSFMDYFCADNKHSYIRSSPVFSLRDPTLAFTNAGMNQFKDVFLGIVQPAFTRVANSQKCIRIGGTHNDLKQVGEDNCHHTFFEMLGNWSFGDYFKEEACRMSWELLTKVYNIPTERLYVTYFKGDRALGLDADVEVQEIWRKIGVKENHILGFGLKENFWSGNTTGPCGPCTEIHYDHCPGRTDAGNLVNSGSNEVIELWNIVFTQYDRKSPDELTKLNTHFVDTGMGFERLVAVLQGKTSNYETDLFSPLFEVIRKHTGHSGYTGKYDGSTIDYSYRVLADHSRMIAVALSDGMIPNHQAKVRGIIKRTLSISEKVFGQKTDLLKELTSHVAHILSDAYPEIEKNLPKIHYIIDAEANLIKINMKYALCRWNKIKKSYPTLDEGDVIETPQILGGLDYIRKNILSPGKKTLTGENIFVLFDTYGIPVYNMEKISLKLGLQFNMDDYENYVASKKATDKKHIHEKYLSARSEYLYLDVINKLMEKKIQSTYDYFKYDYRPDGSGKYIFKNQETTIEAIICGDNLLDEISPGDIQDGKEIGLILDRTQLFSEEGGQVSDCGVLEIEKEITFHIKRLVKIRGFVIHFGHFKDFPSNAKVTVPSLGVVKMDEDARLKIMRNHTALHLVNAALREKLYITGEKLSKVTPDKFSLNFMVYQKGLHSEDDIKKVEKYVKDFILHDVSVKKRIFNHSQFHELDDVVIVPGETILGHEIPVIEINSGFRLSREYCTGTHVLNTSDLEDFVITKYLKGSFNVHLIEGATGEKCLRIREADSEIKENWLRLEKEISECTSSNPLKANDLDLKVKKFALELDHHNEISYLNRCKINLSIQETKNKIVSLKKLFVRNFLKEEITKASEATQDNFVVHCVDRCWDFHPDDLENVASFFQDKPLLIFFKYQDSVTVQCVVPPTFVSKNFSARKWLVDSVISLSGKATCKMHQNQDLIFFLTDRKITEGQLEKIMKNATDIAKKKIGS